jgi:hypothetical protein
MLVIVIAENININGRSFKTKAFIEVFSNKVVRNEDKSRVNLTRMMPVINVRETIRI